MEEIEKLKSALAENDTIIIGAGSGLSTSAGFTYSGERFEKYFFDFAEAFGIRDIYSGGFFPFPNEETLWAWWARHIYFNRYIKPPKNVYEDLLFLVKEKDYFVLTTNVDHQFQRAGFDKKRLFYTQGDYGLFQTVDGKNSKTYDNKEWVMKAMEAQGFILDSNGIFHLPESGELKMQIPSSLIPKCPDNGSVVTMNLRSDDTFVQDDGWYKAAELYENFLRTRKVSDGGKVLFLELGVGANTPVIIKYPFWQMTAKNQNAVYACVNYGEAIVPREIANQSICINGDIGEIVKEMLK
ncbi:MAG: Sir2 silent information regulator family NAD-dependent deacetylase [Spirochaetales bacterium]|nr:Sir2 silent information regulator family NAD-dependent deacetylase [Spirochaetales bacterium]